MQNQVVVDYIFLLGRDGVQKVIKLIAVALEISVEVKCRLLCGFALK